ncbi:hypothetical protein NLG97_g4067 [Lecanicillium saksenae]|uniref:Uncharacterized protein n=1 Tax=Lecanicillium saksenae TaxID=468837 RepID=A0ACC1QWD8_9HYPO|nr:hypothetical protein NLG97_g4067 [Lecanicillium saksenae]
MRFSTISTLAMASAAAGASLQARHYCSGFDDSCGPWNLTVDGNSWTMGMNCTNISGGQTYSEINLDHCLGNSFGKLVSGDGFKGTCDKYPQGKPVGSPREGSNWRNPITVACQDNKGGNPVSTIELHYIMCNDNGVVHCQNQYDKHLDGL